MDVIYFTASTVNGYLADLDNSLEWLFEVDATEIPDHSEFISTVGAMAMGATTYQWLLDNQQLLENPQMWIDTYGDMPVYVFTHREFAAPVGCNFHFISGDPADHMPTFEKAAAGKKLWVMGGGELVGQFTDAGLLTEIVLSIAPATLAAGAPLLPRTLRQQLTLQSVKQYGPFAELTYRVG